MAELATIARPYAEALFRAIGGDNAPALASQLEAVGQVSSNPQLRQFADSPKVSAQQVFDLRRGGGGGREERFRWYRRSRRPRNPVR